MQIEVTYQAKWRIKNMPNYVWTENKRLINLNTGKELKKTLKGMVPGYWIGRQFLKLNELKTKVELIHHNPTPPF